uniref:EF-hand domain-containing protein n=1 Tax=Euplotes crassus TaxID=5936 RepID=A0A7S3KPW0_EUPCR|mmetsp:Transcript_36402/g.36023  ORF Transcript_36402/g.36023 Transcript_36402/m.36023 type:complete len:965 (+) Transcript_36402:11-2905(+)
MASTYARKVGFSGTNTVHTFKRDTTATQPIMDIRPKVTAGLNTTHGLKKLDGGNDLNSLLAQVATYKFKDYFLDFDRLRKGFVSETRFRSGLGMVNVEFTEDDIKKLLNKYQDSTREVNYRQFCEDVDKYFRKEASATGSGSSKFTREEVKVLTDSLKELRSVIKANRILLKPTFSNFDRTNKQRVTAQQFARVLKQLSIMPSIDEFDLICRNYFDKGNTREVNYVKFCHDVDKPEDMFADLGIKIDKYEEQPIELGSSSVLGRATKSNFFADTTKGINVLENRFSKPTINLANDPNDCEERIQNQVVIKRVRIGEFFRDYDKLRKGEVTANQFTSVMRMLDFNLSNEEFDFLTEKYKTDTGMVKYRDFVENIDQIFTIKGIDKMPSAKVPQIDKKTVLAKSKKHLEFDNDEQQSMYEIIEAYQNVVSTRRLNLKPIFQDFDRTKCGHITKTQFVRVLNQLGIDLSHEVLSNLLKRYMDKGNADEVNYFEFINDVDRPENIFGAGRDFNHSYDYFSVTDPRKVGAQIAHLEPEDVDDILARIRKVCSEKRIRLEEFFRDFDRLRSGNITKPQFRIGMNMAKIDLSTSEFDLLCSHYNSKKIGMFRWKEFCDNIDEIFTKKELEKDATMQVTKPSIMTKYGTVSAPKQDKSLASKLVTRFKEKLRRERLDAKSFFQSWDKHNRFKVSPKQFRQVLATCGFDMTDTESEALCKNYCNQDGEIEYLNFLADANPEICVELEETKSKYISKQRKFDGVTAFDRLMEKIKTIVKKGRIRLLDFFQDHDALRKGYVPYMKFKGVLRGQNIELTDKEYDTLIEKFSLPDDPNMINYIDFNEDIELIFTKKGLEKEPTTQVQEFKIPSLIDPDDVLTDDEEKVLEECLQRIGFETKNRRLLIKPFIQDKDKIRRGIVANSRFRSIFDFLKLYITDEEYKIINKRFVGGAPDEINYIDFDNVLKRYSGDDVPF